jgi:hypothetical protein
MSDADSAAELQEVSFFGLLFRLEKEPDNR